MSKTAENIKRLRIAKNLTQQELADLMGKDKTAVSNWERAKNKIYVDDLEKLCFILGCTPEELLGWKSSEEKAILYSDLIVNEVMQNPVVKEIEAELAKMTPSELKRYLRLAPAAKDEV